MLIIGQPLVDFITKFINIISKNPFLKARQKYQMFAAGCDIQKHCFVIETTFLNNKPDQSELQKYFLKKKAAAIIAFANRMAIMVFTRL